MNCKVHHQFCLNPYSPIDLYGFCISRKLKRKLNRESYNFDNYFRERILVLISISMRSSVSCQGPVLSSVYIPAS